MITVKCVCDTSRGQWLTAAGVGRREVEPSIALSTTTIGLAFSTLDVTGWDKQCKDSEIQMHKNMFSKIHVQLMQLCVSIGCNTLATAVLYMSLKIWTWDLNIFLITFSSAQLYLACQTDKQSPGHWHQKLPFRTATFFSWH